MRIDSAGNLLVGITSARANAGDVQVSKGISFPATQSAQSDANTLDDYEEGTWTPTLTFATAGNLSVTYTRNAGRYQKIGNTVYISFTIVTSTFTHTTASGALQVEGLPFTSLNATSNYASLAFGMEGYTKANYTTTTCSPVLGTTRFEIGLYGSGQTVATVSAGDVPTGTRKIIEGQISYQV